MTVTTFTMVSVLLTSALAWVSLVTLGWTEEQMKDRVPIMIALTSGVLIGESAFHLMPESARHGLSVIDTFLWVAAGLGISLSIEMGIKRLLTQVRFAPVAQISLLAETVHNAMDGALIAAAYLVSVRVGVLATFAVLVHELPHELGNYFVLVHGGFERRRAILFNALSATAGIFAAGFVLYSGRAITEQSKIVLPIAAGCFLYIAAVDLIPDLWRDSGLTRRKQLSAWTAAGLVTMLGMTFIR